MKVLFSDIDALVNEYETGHIILSDSIQFSTKKTIKQITHYIMSRYVDAKDNVGIDGRRMPFRNVGNSIVDIETRAKNIDRKAFEPQALDGDWAFALVLRKELQQWMKTHNFGEVIDDYQRKKTEYGSVLLQKTETKDELTIDVAQWSNMVVDANDITEGIKIQKYYLLPTELEGKKDVWKEEHLGESGLAKVLRSFKARKVKDRRIEIWDIEGTFDWNIFSERVEGEDVKTDYALCHVVVGFAGKEKIPLFKEKMKESRYMHFKRKSIEGRDFGVGVWEECFEPQIWTNEAVISEKEVMDIAGKVAIKSNKKDLPSALSMFNGEIIDLAANEFFDPVHLAPNTLPEYQRQIDNWFVNLQRDQSAYPGVTGEAPKADTSFAAQALQAAQSGSIFNKRRDRDGFDLAQVVTKWVIPFLVKQISKTHELSASYSDKELERIDASIKAKAKRSFMIDQLVTRPVDDIAELGIPSPLQFQGVERGVDEQLAQSGSERKINIPSGYFTVEKIMKKTLLDITDEQSDNQRKLNALATTLQAMNPQDPQRVEIIKEMMSLSGISPASFPIGGSGEQSSQAPQGGQLDRALETALPAGQQ